MMPPSIPLAQAGERRLDDCLGARGRGSAESPGKLRGQTAYMTADLEKIIGRPATSYAQWAIQHVDAYR